MWCMEILVPLNLQLNSAMVLHLNTSDSWQSERLLSVNWGAPPTPLANKVSKVVPAVRGALELRRLVEEDAEKATELTNRPVSFC